DYKDRDDVIVLALPRGGVPVAYEVSKALHVPLDVFIVRKLGVPGHEELAMGAIASGGVRVMNEQIVNQLWFGPEEIDRVAQQELKELERRERQYRGDRPPPDVEGKIVILIDDGLATGATMRAAAKALRGLNPAKLVIAVPAASPDTCEAFRAGVDEIICAITSEPFYAVGVWYEDVSQTSDEEVSELLQRVNEQLATHAGRQ